MADVEEGGRPAAYENCFRADAERRGIPVMLGEVSDFRDKGIGEGGLAGRVRSTASIDNAVEVAVVALVKAERHVEVEGFDFRALGDRRGRV